MTPAYRLAVLGATGFIGSGLIAQARVDGVDVTPVSMVRVAVDAEPNCTIADSADRWQRANQRAFDDLCRALAIFDVVINAASDPRSGSTNTANLLAANAVLPAIVARAAGAAGVRRLVHVSTAAVQGRLDPLDETAVYSPLSPYASSKARSEQHLLDARTDRGEVTPELVVYRPASVQAVGHQATRAFARLVPRLPLVPVPGSGDRPVPVALLDNVASGILFAATMEEPCRIILQPDEGVTVRRLVELFGARRVAPLPPKVAGAMLNELGKLTRPSAHLTSRFRWLELILRGQATNANALRHAGFVAPVGFEGWQALARSEQCRQ